MITEDKLLELGFVKREFDEGGHDYCLPLRKDDSWKVEVILGIQLVELVHQGHAVPLDVKTNRKLEQLIQVL